MDSVAAASGVERWTTRDPQRKVLTLSQATAWRRLLRHAEASVAVTNGCFDVLHAGHVRSLLAARCEADALLVLVNGDDSVRALKGDGRPVNTEQDRAYLLAALECVGAVVVFPGTDCAAELGALAPDVYVKSSEYRGCQHPAEKAALEAVGARVIWQERLEGYSSSAVMERLGG